MKSMIFEKMARYVLLCTALLPLVVVNSFLYPFVSGKVFAFRILVGAALVLVCVYVAASLIEKKYPRALYERMRMAGRHIIFLSLAAFALSAIVSMAFSIYPYQSWWGNIERGDGVFGLLCLALFFVLLTIFFKTADWKRFFKLSLLVGVVTICYGWLEYFGIIRFSSNTEIFSRPGSFFGNPAFFAAYLIFLASIAGVLYVWLSREEKMWRSVALAVGVVAMITIFITGTRGAMIGLLVAICFLLVIYFKRHNAQARRYMRWGLVACVVLLGLIYFSRGSHVWDSVPGVGRLIRTDVSDAGIQPRLYAWKAGMQAFIEHPIVGWGPEHYSVVHNSYYDPKMAQYEELWFDRPHNKLIEVLVHQGILGILSYVVFLGSIIFLLIKNARRETDSGKRNMLLFLSGGMVAYATQNLFLFDSPMSNMFLFVFASFTLYLSIEGKEVGEEIVTISSRELESKRIIAIGISSLLALGTIYVVYVTNVAPMRQLLSLSNALHENEEEKILGAMRGFIEPYTFIQPEMRRRFLEVLITSGVARTYPDSLAVQVAVKALEDVAAKEARYEPRNFITLANAYNERGKENSVFFAKAEEYARSASLLAPKRPSIYYPLSLALAGQGKFDEAVAVARETLALNPMLPKVHFNLGLHLSFSGRQFWDEAEIEFKSALDSGGIPDSSLKKEDLNNLSEVYKEMLFAYIMEHNGEKTVRVAEQFKRIEEAPIGDLDTIISLAKDKNWQLLEEAVGQ